MGRLFIILIAIAAFFTWRRWRKLETSQQRRDFIYKGMVFGLVILIIGLAVFGRIDVLGAIFATVLLCIKYILALAIRYFPFIARLYGMSNAFGAGKDRTLRTAWLEASVNFSSRQIQGRVIQGQFEGRTLDSMSQEELQQLLEECREDSKSVYILKAYLSQRFQSQQSNGQSSQSGSYGTASMSREEALEILGLEGSPTEKEIKMAHKKLMQKLHPDRGGNDFLASLLNRARDQLIHK